MKTLLLNLLLVGAILSTCIFSGCVSSYYMPNAQNVPLHSEKDQASFNASLGTSFEVASLDVQGSYAFEDNFALMVNGQFASSGDQNIEGENSGKGNIVELGLGFYEPLSKKFIFETYVGGGGGSAINRYDNSARSRVGIRKIFIQPQIGFKTKNFDFAFTNRLNWISYNNADVIGMLPGDETAAFNYILNSRSTFVVEPGFTMRIGSDPIKLQVQLVISNPNANGFDLNQEYFILSAGIHASL